jgi:hypothetical protein
MAQLPSPINLQTRRYLFLIFTKTAVQNDLVNFSKGDILIFTDAASFLPKYALKKIVRNFADDRVGGVAGRLRFVDTDIGKQPS